MAMLKTFLKGILPTKLYKALQQVFWGILSRRNLYKQKLVIKNIRRKQKKALLLINPEHVKCVFLCLFDSTWKYDYVYQKMLKDPRFDPIIIVCPVVNNGYENMLSRMEDCYNFFVNKNYNVIKAFNKENGKYLDLRKEVNPDILFYTNPYKGLIDDRYYIDAFTDHLTVYVPYAINNNKDYHYTYNLPFHNYLWRHYVESDVHYLYAKNNTICKGDNAKPVGYPGIEVLIDANYNPSLNQWKIKNNQRKRIIWAPHHTVEPVGNCFYSCFLQYCDIMISLAKKYDSQVQFVFKPHPLLRNKLDKLWGKERTNDYYNKWKTMSNTALKEGDYVDLFLTSDAMIHDSGSFLIEYLYVNKPVMRTINGLPLNQLYNSFAIDCLNCYYMAYSEQDIEQFINNVINGIDPLKEQRTKFLNEVLMPKGSPSENIVNDIIDSIKNQRVFAE